MRGSCIKYRKACESLPELMREKQRLLEELDKAEKEVLKKISIKRNNLRIIQNEFFKEKDKDSKYAILYYGLSDGTQSGEEAVEITEETDSELSDWAKTLSYDNCENYWNEDEDEDDEYYDGAEVYYESGYERVGAEEYYSHHKEKLSKEIEEYIKKEIEKYV